MFDPLLLWFHKREVSHTWNQTVLTSKLVQQDTSKRKSCSNSLDLARLNKCAGTKMFEPLFSCLSLVEQVCCSKLFGSKCDLLVSCETTREVVQTFLTRHASTSVPGQQMFDPLVFVQKSWLTSGSKACWVTICWSPEINILDPAALAFRHG